MADEVIEKYGARWPAGTSELAIEMACIRKGGKFKDSRNNDCGEGLSHHFERMRNILWPDLDDHRWHRLCRDAQIQNKITVLMGPGSSGKTHEAAWLRLCEYYCSPQDTLVLVSSTDLRGLELRVWGEIKTLHEKAQAQFNIVPGNLVDSKHAICTDDIEEDSVRDLRKGIIGIPCVQNGKFVGINKYCGIKQRHIRLVADEASMMSISFLNAFANLDKNVDFRATVLGNPIDPLDPLGKAAEPLDGWTNHLEPSKTSVWKTRFMGGTCVNLVGTDSPNFDYPINEPARFPYLISPQKIANTLSFFAKDSVEYYSQCVGVMKIGMLAKRVLTLDMCRQFKAQDLVTWKGVPLTKIYALDASYGGDRCVGGAAEFGLDINGKIILAFEEPHIIPIIVGEGEPEEQIAKRVRAECEARLIPPENMFHDATGRGSLGTALARVWSAMTNPIEFGGRPTDRPVCLDLFIIDPLTKQKRLKRCDEHYDRFVTELWFSVRYAVESEQVKRLPEEAKEELCLRSWELKNTKLSVEVKSGTPTKPGMKQRTGRSPDYGDWSAIIVEGARRRGFQISKLANQEDETQTWEWLENMKRKTRMIHESKQLDYAA